MIDQRREGWDDLFGLKIWWYLNKLRELLKKAGQITRRLSLLAKITIAGVVFSITLVALSLVTSQLGPRQLRNFMRDTLTQVVLGTFVATFLYCLVVLQNDAVWEHPSCAFFCACLLALIAARPSPGKRQTAWGDPI